jgi:hypothetical protein
MQFIQGQGLDLVIEELAHLRARSAATGANPRSPSGRLLRSSRAGGSPEFGAGDSLECTVDEAAEASNRDLSLTRMAQSLLVGRFAIAERASDARDQPDKTAVDGFAVSDPERGA